MTSLRRVACAALCLVIPAHVASAQSSSDARLRRAKAAAERIRADDILRDVSALASDANMGRRTPFPGLASPGFDSAAHYVAAFLRKAGVRPMGDDGTYFQHYTRYPQHAGHHEGGGRHRHPAAQLG